MGGLGAVGASPIFGLQLAEQYRGNDHFLSVASSSRRETMVGGALSRVSALRVGLGVGGAALASGSLSPIAFV